MDGPSCIVCSVYACYYMSFPSNKLHSNTRILERPEPWSRMEIVLWASHTSYVTHMEFKLKVSCLADGHSMLCA